ncbi:MAG: 5-formyltetrahydrofolate cyclo-ligase [Candidatus Aenigmarchaeota archaeon]|nr:5-formyltetrahydrofolate cyclo-ligase [Candidatus Aenigmarchaeota archaeon]
MEKEDIRKKILSLRDSLTEEEMRSKSGLIQKRLFNLPEFKKARTIFFYVSTRNEVKTERMIKSALNLGKRVVVPISDVKERKLILSELKDFDKELEPGAFNILEPKREFFRPVLSEEVDFIIVPGIAFDKNGDRIGYGMGFYDKFLSSLKKRVPTVGLAYEFQMVDDIPVDDKDVTVDKVLTEERTIECFKL